MIKRSLHGEKQRIPIERNCIQQKLGGKKGLDVLGMI